MPCYDAYGERMKELKLHALTAMLCNKHPKAAEFAERWRQAHHEFESLEWKNKGKSEALHRLDAVIEEAYKALCKQTNS
jgi:hypothetical protein